MTEASGRREGVASRRAPRRKGLRWRPTQKQLIAVLGDALLLSQAWITLSGGTADASIVLAGVGLLGGPLVKSAEERDE